MVQETAFPMRPAKRWSGSPPPDRLARQLLGRDVEPGLSGEMFACLATAEEAPRLHNRSPARVLNLRNMMLVFGGQGQNSNRVKRDYFEPCNGREFFTEAHTLSHTSVPAGWSRLAVALTSPQCVWLEGHASTRPSTNPGLGRLGRGISRPRHYLGKNDPGDAGELVRKGDRQNIMV